MHVIKVTLNDGTRADANAAATFRETIGTQAHTFAVTRRPHVDRGWCLTHVDSGLRLCRLPELPMVAKISAKNAESTGRLALQELVHRYTLAVVATKLQQAAA